MCNVAYSMQVEWMDEKEFESFERELPSDPSEPAGGFGTADLMRLMSTMGGG